MVLFLVFYLIRYLLSLNQQAFTLVASTFYKPYLVNQQKGEDQFNEHFLNEAIQINMTQLADPNKTEEVNENITKIEENTNQTKIEENNETQKTRETLETNEINAT